MPEAMKYSTINFYTVGWKQNPWYELAWKHGDLKAALQRANDLQPEESLLLDCRACQGAREGVGCHLGSSTRVLRNIMSTDIGVMRELCQKVAERACQTGTPLKNIITFCDHGKHRSVGCATLLQGGFAMLSDQWRFSDRTDLCRSQWSKKKCGWVPCQECDEENAEKRKLYAQVALLIRDALARVTT